jgi:hypothetical protein
MSSTSYTFSQAKKDARHLLRLQQQRREQRWQQQQEEEERQKNLEAVAKEKKVWQEEERLRQQLLQERWEQQWKHQQEEQLVKWNRPSWSPRVEEALRNLRARLSRRAFVNAWEPAVTHSGRLSGS